MKEPDGCLGGLGLGGLWEKVFGSDSAAEGDRADEPFEPLVSAGWDQAASVSLFSLPGHGRTSFVWSLVYMLRQLSRVWGGYVCWPRDEATGRALVDVHEHVRLGLLPERWSEEDGAVRYALQLRNLSPWGDRNFVIWDAADPAFTPERLDPEADETPEMAWNRPGLWLLSLSDLDATRGRFLDLSLDEIVRARQAADGVARDHPFRLVVVLTKGDALSDLPRELRGLLKEDPLAKALAAGPEEPPQGDDDLDLSAPPRPLGSYPEGDPVNAYFESRNLIHELTRDWLYTNSSGRSLLERAEELRVELKLSVVSATGSGFTSGRRLARAWSPRRVLDPYFWCLEMGG